MKCTKTPCTMKIVFLIVVILILSCDTHDGKIDVDRSRHEGLVQFETTGPYKVLYSEGQSEKVKKQDSLIKEAYRFLSAIMGPKKEFYLLVVAGKDWSKNAYSPVPGMPEYYKGNLIVGADQNELAMGYEEIINGFPKVMTSDLIETYTNTFKEFDMSLFFDKLSIHELTHNFQDPKNREGYSMSRWLEEIHANMGLYAFYKSKHPKELKYITALVNFSLEHPSPNKHYSSLSDFNTYYYEMNPENYGFYQMKFTKAAEMLIDSLGNDILKPLNDFIIRYDESWKEKLTEIEFQERLSTEVHPYFMNILKDWPE